MKMIAMLAIMASGFGLATPAASVPLAKGISPAVSPSRSLTMVCDCDRRADVPAGFYGGFVDAPYDSRYVDGYTSGFVSGSDLDNDSAAPPYASFPDRRRVYRMWGWQRTYADPAPLY